MNWTLNCDDLDDDFSELMGWGFMRLRVHRNAHSCFTIRRNFDPHLRDLVVYRIRRPDYRLGLGNGSTVLMIVRAMYREHMP